MADRNQLDLLVIEDDDALYIFDRTYVDYKKFDEYTDNGTRFLTRLKGNARREYIETRTEIIDGKEVKVSIVKIGREGHNQTSNVYNLASRKFVTMNFLNPLETLSLCKQKC